MATIGLPTSFEFASVEAGYEFAQGVGTNPYNMRTIVDNYGGKRRVLNVTTPKLFDSDRSDWTTFINSLQGSANTFVIPDISKYFPNEVTNPATQVTFRMVGSPNWSWSVPFHIQLSFTAVEVVT